ncbi:MAG: YtxH domain-containing protein [Chitinophagaceae bacterium]|nr:MAG: YtxH domain-containing protein [Chitinophagaceae bacterium]
MKLVLCFFALGVVTGILIAPEKGSLLRERLAQLADDLALAKDHLTNPDLEA